MQYGLFEKLLLDGYVFQWTIYAEWRLVMYKITCFYFWVDICYRDFTMTIFLIGEVLDHIPTKNPLRSMAFLKNEHNSLIFDLNSMKLCTFIPILNRHVVKFREKKMLNKRCFKVIGGQNKLFWSKYKNMLSCTSPASILHK